MANEIIVEYPLRQSETKWTSEYRKEWNREYRRKIKEGLIQPVKRKEEPSKWDDKQFRKAYDDARKKKINEEKKQQKLNGVSEVRPNFTQEEKDFILNRLIDEIKNGNEPTHPYFKLGLMTIGKRTYPKKTQEKSSP